MTFSKFCSLFDVVKRLRFKLNGLLREIGFILIRIQADVLPSHVIFKSKFGIV